VGGFSTNYCNKGLALEIQDPFKLKGLKQCQYYGKCRPKGFPRKSWGELTSNECKNLFQNSVLFVDVQIVESCKKVIIDGQKYNFLPSNWDGDKFLFIIDENAYKVSIESFWKVFFPEKIERLELINPYELKLLREKNEFIEKNNEFKIKKSWEHVKTFHSKNEKEIDFVSWENYNNAPETKEIFRKENKRKSFLIFSFYKKEAIFIRSQDSFTIEANYIFHMQYIVYGRDVNKIDFPAFLNQKSFIDFCEINKIQYRQF